MSTTTPGVNPYSSLMRLPGSTFIQRDRAQADPNNEFNIQPGELLDLDGSIFTGDRAQFQSKYNWPEYLGPGRYALTFQKPGGHKYDTLRAEYTLDPATGEYVMQGQPVSTRQVSSSQNARDAAEKGIPFVGAVLGGAYGLSTLAGGAGAGTLTAAEAAATADYAAIQAGASAGTQAAAAGGASTVGSGAWNGTNFTGTTPFAGSSNLGTLASASSSAGPATMANTFGGSAMSGFGDWIQLGGLVNSIVNKPKPADTSGLTAAAVANAGIAERQQGLAEKTYADSQALFNEFKPFLVEQMKTSASEQQKSIGRSDDQWNSYLTTYRPIEQQMAEKSLNWASDSRMKSEAERAGSEVTGEFDRARTTTTRNLSMAGASPEKIAALEAASRLQEAQAVGGAQGNARRAVEKEGMAYLDNVARFGRGMPSTGLAAAGLAGAQGQQANTGYRTLADATIQPAAAANPLFNSAVNSNGSAGDLFGGAAKLDYQSELNNWQIGMGAITGLNRAIQSSKTLKDVGDDVKGAGDKVERSGAKHWAYKKGLGDGSTKPRMGPMAEDLHREAPEVSNGQELDPIAMHGLHHAAIGDHNRELRSLKKEVKSLKRRLTLADAAA